MQVLRDFRVPDGVSPDDIDANGDGEVLAVLNLQVCGVKRGQERGAPRPHLPAPATEVGIAHTCLHQQPRWASPTLALSLGRGGGGGRWTRVSRPRVLRAPPHTRPHSSTLAHTFVRAGGQGARSRRRRARGRQPLPKAAQEGRPRGHGRGGGLLWRPGREQPAGDAGAARRVPASLAGPAAAATVGAAARRGRRGAQRVSGGDRGGRHGGELWCVPQGRRHARTCLRGAHMRWGRARPCGVP
eukprot:362190-Chlamydomonas_euryale.AAC.3